MANVYKSYLKKSIKSFFRKYLFRKPSTSGIGIINLSIVRPFFLHRDNRGKVLCCEKRFLTVTQVDCLWAPMYFLCFSFTSFQNVFFKKGIDGVLLKKQKNSSLWSEKSNEICWGNVLIVILNFWDLYVSDVL